MSFKWQGICLWAVLLGLFAPLVHAQSVASPEDEYKKLIRVNEDIQPLGEYPFGENISLYDGSLTFQQTDVSASGNGPLLQLGRKFQIDGVSALMERAEYAFGDWSIDLPHLETLTGSGYAYSSTGWITVDGWEVDTSPGIDPNARCSSFRGPLTISQHKGDSALVPWRPESWWKGYHLVMPGQGSEDMLSNRDTATKDLYPVVTKSQWRFSCLTTTANGQPGEGFLAQAPDGTKYWFNQLVYRYAQSMSRPLYSSDLSDTARPNGGFFEKLMASHADPVADLLGMLTGSSLARAAPAANTLGRKKALMLVTKVQDRFGNTLTYNYDANGNLTGISASDGRALAVQYVSGTPRIQSITLQPASGAARTWTYAYNANGTSLTAVTLPDGSQWHYSLANFGLANLSTGTNYSSCIAVGAPSNLDPITGTITHPSGLTGAFAVKPVRHGRSYVPQDCRGMFRMNPNTQHSYALMPNAWYSFSITQRVLSGAAIPASTWLYSYSVANDSWSDCGSNCPTTVYSDVVSPDGSTQRSTFSNKYDYTESQLLRTDYYSGAAGSSTLVRSEVNSYAAPTTAPLPASAGSNLQANVNWDQTTKYSPLNKRVITQDGNTYTWQATAFNTYAQVTKTKRVSNVPGQTTAVEEQTTYLNDVPHWSLGLPTETKNLTNNEVVDNYVYDLANVTLKERWHFGQKLMSYTFNSAGQLASFTDGNSKTTTLSNYKRGIPQTIKTPDTKTQTLVVDDFGQIASITDQAGSKTSYTYDAVGRLTGISYPTGDEQAWLPKTFAYARATAAERGLAANHWRRTVSQGNARAVTYFDALLRPVLSDSYITGVSGSNTTTLTNYDTKGQTVFASYPDATALNFTNTPGSLKGTTSTYDALGRLTRTQQSSELGTLTTTTAYAAGATRKVTDPKGNVTTTTYQVFDQPSYDAPIKVVAPEGVTQTITRDLYGHPTAITQSGTYGTESLNVKKTFVYDSHYRLCRTIEPESLSTVMAYDNANNLAWSATGISVPLNDLNCREDLAPAAARTTRTYDAMNRLLTILPPAGTQSTSYTYDALGNLKTAVSGISTWSATYNKRGMLTGESLLLVGQNPWAIGYAHDTYGHLSLTQYPDGESVNYAPDALGRPTQVGSYLTHIGYYPNGEVAGATLGNGVDYATHQNDRQLLDSFGYGEGDNTIYVGEAFTYDKNANIIQVKDLVNNPQRDKTFGYDALNRLTSATATALWGTETYAYDPINNIRQRVNGSQTTTYNYDTRNRLSSLTGTGATSFGYDERGNVTSKGSVTLGFDAKNQLTALPGMAYVYDAAGRRVSKTPTSGSPTYSFYNQAGQLMYQVEPGLAKTTSFAYLGRKLVGDNESIALGAPGAVSFSANASSGSYTVSWGTVLAATSYTLQENANGAGWTTVYTGSAASKALSGKAGGSYTYQVRGCIGSTCGGWSLSATLGVSPALPTITVPSGTINGSYTVSWTAPASATGYDVEERLGSGSWTAITGNPESTSISRLGTTSGSYTYRVSAKNGYGTRGWATSSAVTVDTDYGKVPALPVSFTVPATSSTGSAPLSWSATDLATRYVAEQSGNGGTSWSGVYDGSTTSKTVSGLANGSYIYRVQACNTYGCSPWTAGSATLVVTHPPASAPTVTTPASNTTGSYTVSWGAVSTATSYTLQEKVGTGSWATIQTSSATSKAISGKGNGSYGYQVQACNAGGCSAWSGTKTTTVLLKPAAPGSITVPATSSGSIAVSWSASATATSYTLQQRLGTGSWSSVYTGATTSSTRTVTASGSYTYQVQACNASGCSAYKASNAVTVTIPPASAPTLTVPATSGTGSYTTSWTAVTGATSYTLQEKVGSGSWAAAYTGSAKSKAISGKGNGSYGYRVQACNAGGCGAWSSTKTITVALVPPVPTGVQVVSYTVTNKFAGFRAQWDEVSGATSYEVRRVDTGATVYAGPATSYVLYQGPQPLDFNERYDVQVRACNAAGCSGWAS